MIQLISSLSHSQTRYPPPISQSPARRKKKSVIRIFLIFLCPDSLSPSSKVVVMSFNINSQPVSLLVAENQNNYYIHSLGSMTTPDGRCSQSHYSNICPRAIC